MKLCPKPGRLSPARKTLVCTLLLVALVSAAPFLCLLPFFGGGTSTQEAPQSQAAPTATLPPGAAAAPAIEQDPLLIWDNAEGLLRTVPVVDYLIGSAACEVPLDWPDDAIRAQMVASHSYILYRKANADGSNSGAYLAVNSAQNSGWTTNDVLSSRWGDAYGENYARLAALAKDVQYRVLLYGDEPAAACYHAASAGHTEASQNVWNEALPYLQGVESSWDKYADDYEVSIEYTRQQFYDALAMNLGLTPEGEPETWLGDTVWDEAGYVQSIELCGETFTGVKIRSALSLRSACFAIAYADGQFVITTRGYGHGVGLSQNGACAMAKGGSTWEEILAYYFPGTTLGVG